MPSKNDLEFGKLSISSQYASAQQVEECLALQNRLEQGGSRLSLDRVLFMKGYLDLDQLGRIQQKQKRKIIFCLQCQTRMNISGFDAGQKVRCPQCGKRVRVPDGVLLPEERDFLAELKEKLETEPSPGPPELQDESSPADEEEEVDTVMIEAEAEDGEVMEEEGVELEQLEAQEAEDSAEEELQAEEESVQQEEAEKEASKKGSGSVEGAKRFSRLRRFREETSDKKKK